jgi:23S rRNA pseudouridine1911/1915/1917 synthase
MASPRPPRQFTVAEPGELLGWVIANVPGVTRTEAKGLLRHRVLLVNGVPAERHDVPLRPGDVVSVPAGGGGGAARLPEPPPFPILYEDEHLVAIDKPSGLLTVGTDSERARTAHRILGERARRMGTASRRVFVVHRLDRETSGVLLFAHSEDAKRRLQADWDRVEKEYLAVVDGLPDPPEATLVDILREDPGGLAVYRQPDGAPGRRAVLHYRTLAAHGGRALVAVQLETGRKHQIRVQLAGIGTPVAGDERYGTGRRAPRLALHAARIIFRHPATGRRMIIESPLPAELARLVPR